MAALDFDTANVQPLESIAELKALADIRDVAGRYTELKQRKGRAHEHWGCCPFHSERTPSFKVNQSKQNYHCFGCGAHGDVIDLIVGLERLDRGDAIWHLRKLVGRDHASSRPAIKPRPVAPASPPAPPARFQDAAAHTWRACRPITPDTPAAAYLASRKCRLPHEDGDLHWYDRLRHPCGYIGPALVGLVTHAVTGEPLTLHRTWLRHDGSGKADVDPPRMLWAGLPKAGGVIRLWPDEKVTTGLCVAEGIETALTAAPRLRPRLGLHRRRQPRQLPCPAWHRGADDLRRP
jgi:CHC2-type zinc finger protein